MLFSGLRVGGYPSFLLFAQLFAMIFRIFTIVCTKGLTIFLTT